MAREVSSDPETYSAVFLGMPNAAYCHWIVNPVNWGGGIELSILARCASWGALALRKGRGPRRCRRGGPSSLSLA